MKDTLKSFTDIAEVFASPKRLLILKKLENDKLGYLELVGGLLKLGVKIGPSEMYKHFQNLMKHKYIVKQGSCYMITSKGVKALELIEKLSKEKPRIPKVKMIIDFDDIVEPV